MGIIALKEVDSTHKPQSPVLQERIENCSRCATTHLLLALENGIEVGFVALDYHMDQGIMVVYELFVDPNHRRRGIARQILRESELLADALRFSSIRLKPKPLERTVPIKDLIAFYISEGYVRTETSEFLRKPLSLTRIKDGG